MNHTPTPWMIDGETMGGIGISQEGKPGLGVAAAYGDSREECIANAEFICRAVNAHDELLAACERIHRRAKTGRPIQVSDMRILESAIAKARGELAAK